MGFRLRLSPTNQSNDYGMMEISGWKFLDEKWMNMDESLWEIVC
jgi:hypothetical protein